MNKIPLSLWKVIVRTNRNRALWQKCKDLGKDLGLGDPDWITEGNLHQKTRMGTYQFTDIKSIRPGQPVKILFCCVFWPEGENNVREATIAFYEGGKRLCKVTFLDLEYLELTPGPRIWQQLSQCHKVHLSCPGIPIDPGNIDLVCEAPDPLQQPSRSELSNFSDPEMEKIIRVYQICSPVTFWFIEDMALFLYEKAKTITIEQS